MRILKKSVIPATIFFLLFSCSGKENGRVVRQFDDDWLFNRGEVRNGESESLDDSGWRKLSIPHDWSIEDIPGTVSPFDSTVKNGVASGFTRGGTGWYRKHFSVDKKYSGSKIFIRFDGVYMNSDVWVNGRHAGNHFYGYTGFEYDITNLIRPGRENIVAVRVNNDSVRCRWYSGSGIYRHALLLITSPLHFEKWGISVTTSAVTGRNAGISVNTSVINQFQSIKRANLRLEIFDPRGKLVTTGNKEFDIEPGATTSAGQMFTINDPLLWSPDNTSLYSLIASITLNDRIIDQTTETFGIRTISFDSRNGFFINDKKVKLKGGCIHHDNGPLGAAAFDRAEERKVGLLKAAGFNAIRMAHNPPSPAMLNACDKLGMLVIDEAFDVWRYGHFSGDYGTYFDTLWKSDLGGMVLRDRNHPSVILWSIGNEIRNSDTGEIAELCGTLAGFVRSIDPTRPVTSAVNAISDKKDPYFSKLDVSGYNYRPDLYIPDHKSHPERVMYGSESYSSDAFNAWKEVKNNPWVIGDFVWTSFDYLGEASIGWLGYPQEPGFFPWNHAFCGDLDILGFRRPQSYFRQTLWDSKPVISIFVAPPMPTFPTNPKKADWSVWDWEDAVDSWNFEGFESKPVTVSVYTQCQAAELFLNGKSIGRKANKDKNIIRWQVPYQPGVLKAAGYDNGKAVTEAVLRSAGVPALIKLTPDRTGIKADGQDLCYVIVEITDKNGLRNPSATNGVVFSLTGPGEIAAAGNSDPTSLESFRKSERKAWQGRCMVIIKSGKEKGNIMLKASSPGLPDSEMTISSE